MSGDYKLKTVDAIINHEQTVKFENEQDRLTESGAPSEPIWAYHSWNTEKTHYLLKDNLHPRYAKVARYGPGVYFHEMAFTNPYDPEGMLVCQILPGKSLESRDDHPNKNKKYPGDTSNVPDGFHSKQVFQGIGIYSYVIPRPEQILPRFILRLQE